MKNETSDVLIIGAGPSGLFCAYQLAQQGLRVRVLERKKEIGRDVICTGIISEKAFQEFSLPQNSILGKIQKIQLVSPYHTTLTYEHPQTLAYVVDRGKFDRSLALRALFHGVDIRTNHEVEDISVDKNGVQATAKTHFHTHDSILPPEPTIETRSTKSTRQTRETKPTRSTVFKASLVVLATGVNFNLHKRLGLSSPKNFLNGVQTELELDHPGYPQIYVGKGLSSGAFAWVVPTGHKTARVGLMTEGDSLDQFRQFVKKYYPQHPQSLLHPRIRCKIIAQGLSSQTYAHRILAVGEAAGQVKNTTGGGVYFGLKGAETAARVIARCFDKGNFTPSALEAYEREWKETLKDEILMGYYARKICSRFSDHQIERMFQIARNNGVFPLIKEKGKFDWHSGLIIQLMKHSPIKEILKKRPLP